MNILIWNYSRYLCEQKHSNGVGNKSYRDSCADISQFAKLDWGNRNIEYQTVKIVFSVHEDD